MPSLQEAANWIMEYNKDRTQSWVSQTSEMAVDRQATTSMNISNVATSTPCNQVWSDCSLETARGQEVTKYPLYLLDQQDMQFESVYKVCL